MTARVSPTETIRAEIDELIAGSERGSLLEHFGEVARAAVRGPKATIPRRCDTTSYDHRSGPDR